MARLIAFADAFHPTGGHEETIIDDFNVALDWRVHGWGAYELLASEIWNGESVRLSRSGIWGDMRSLELPDVSGSTGIGSGVKRFRSRTVEKLLDLATTEQVNEH